MRQQTNTIPIVFAMVGDPVGSGFVREPVAAGGNLTGFTPIENSLGGKWVELLKEILTARRQGSDGVRPGDGAVCFLLPEPL